MATIAAKNKNTATRERIIELQKQLNRIQEELTKLLLEQSPPKPARSSASQTGLAARPLDNVKELVASTEDLREANGNLSAIRIAKAFGISVNQLAQWLRRSRQSLSQAPDADSLQGVLSYFERVARLRSVVASDEQFRKWLRMSHPEIAAKNPLELLARGKWQALADFVDDILSGTPG